LLIRFNVGGFVAIFAAKPKASRRLTMAQQVDNQVVGNIGMYYAAYRLSQIEMDMLGRLFSTRPNGLFAKNDDFFGMVIEAG
jgi:hypothetical protein